MFVFQVAVTFLMYLLRNILYFQGHRLKEALQKRTGFPDSLPVAPQIENEDQDTIDARISSDEDDHGESEDSFSNYEEDVQEGLEPEEVKHQ